LSPVAIDLIDKIMALEPMQRLGAPGSEKDIQSLKQHEFFSGIDFSNLDSYDIKEML
jgi:hypothetical protein